MDFHRWSSLLRGYDLTLRYNQLLLILSAAGAVLAVILDDSPFWQWLYQAAVAGATVFLAAALAKELDPDQPKSALLAAVLALAVAWRVQTSGLIALLWLLGCARLINRSTGLRPKPIDTLVLVAAAALLSWFEGALFGILMGVVLIVDALLPDGLRIHAVIGAAVLIASAVWLFLSDGSITSPEPWLVVILLIVAVAFIPVILNYSHVAAVGDATGRQLYPLRVQADQAIALSVGLFLASWRGEMGVALLIGLWAALLGISIHYLVFARLQRSATSL